MYLNGKFIKLIRIISTFNNEDSQILQLIATNNLSASQLGYLSITSPDQKNDLNPCLVLLRGLLQKRLFYKRKDNYVCPYALILLWM